MNKLMGFLELKTLSLPSIDWKEFREDTYLDLNRQWTIRSALYIGKDQSLPRLVGAYGDEAKRFALDLLKELDNQGMVIYYPYFEAIKSGNLEIFEDHGILEGVRGDLWNLVNYSKTDVTLLLQRMQVQCLKGNPTFFSKQEIEAIQPWIDYLRKEFKEVFWEKKGLLLEFSFAHYPKEEECFLIFYELRTI